MIVETRLKAGVHCETKFIDIPGSYTATTTTAAAFVYTWQPVLR